MKKVLMSLSAAAIFILASLSVFAQEQAAKPTFKDGDFWQFNITETGFLASSAERLQGTYELTYLQGKLKINLLTGDYKGEINAGAGYPGESLVALLGLSEIVQNLKFPLGVGQKWSYEYRWPSSGEPLQARSSDVNVSGVEQVTTPAGSFKAFKIASQTSWPRGRGRGSFPPPFHITNTYFYSPETKSVIKSSYVDDDGQKREIELIKFGSAAK